MMITTAEHDQIVFDLGDCFSRSELAVPDQELARHLGLPADAEIDESLKCELERAENWFHESASPWCSANVCEIAEIGSESIRLESGSVLKSDVLARGFSKADVERLAVVAITAGEEIDREIERHFEDGHPDEAMTLNAFAIAAVERVRTDCCRLVEERSRKQGLFALPYYSPGYEGWPLEDQHSLFAAVNADESPIVVLESGGMKPAKSTLFVIGLTRKQNIDPSEFWQRQATQLTTPTHPEYGFSPRTLKKWSRNRLSLGEEIDGRLTASFRTAGSTCANMGLPLAFDYQANLERATDGKLHFTGFSCAPAEGDTNHRSTCQFLSNPDGFAAGIEEHPPLLGKPLEDALHWNPDVSPAGCLCLRSSRDHKWRIVVQTLHYALANQKENEHS